MNLDNLLKFDLSKVDFTKLDIKSFKNSQSIFWVFVISAFILDLCVVLPMSSHIKKAQEKQIQSLKEVSHASQVLGLEKDLIKNRLAVLDNVDELFDNIEALANMNHIAIKINPTLSDDSRTPAQSHYVRKIVHIDASGSFKNLGILLAYIRDLPDAILEIDTMTMSRHAANPTLVDAHFNFVLYAKKDDSHQ
jgi:hypothetical protein